MVPHSYGAIGASRGSFFEVPCGTQKVVKFEGRIHVQLPIGKAGRGTAGRELGNTTSKKHGVRTTECTTTARTIQGNVGGDGET